MTIGELCNREVIIISEDESCAEAARIMRHFHVGDLIVIVESEGGRRPVGILTDRDIVLQVVANNANANTVRVKEIMSSELVTAKEEDGIYETMKRMRLHGVRRMPIVDQQGYLVGILSADDFLEYLCEELDSLIGLFYNERSKEREKMA